MAVLEFARATTGPEICTQLKLNGNPLGAVDAEPSRITFMPASWVRFDPALAIGRSSAMSRVLSARNSFDSIVLLTVMGDGTCAEVTSEPPLVVVHGAAAR